MAKADLLKDLPTFTPRSRAAWRAWLAKHYDAPTEVWCVFFKQGAGEKTLSYDDAVEEALCFGWVDGLKKSIDDARYMFRFTPRKPNSKWSPSNKTRVARLIKSGAMTEAGLCLVEEAKRHGNWDAPTGPQVDFQTPPEFAARLKKDEAAKTFFDSLAPSYQRQYVAWIASAKREETRKRRLEEAMALLKKGEKLGMR